MPGNSGGGGNSTSTVTQTNIPSFLEDPAKQNVAMGQALAGPDAQYQQYAGQRVAGFSPMQEAAFQGVGGMQTPGQFGQANQSLGNAQDIANAGALTASGYQPGQFQGVGYDPAMAQQTGPFDQAAAQQYMSPYQQAVTDYAKQAALTTGQQGLNKLGSTAALAGAYGGSRFGLEQAQMGKDIGYNVGELQAKGSQSAFDRAQTQFNADQNRAQQTNLANQSAANQAAMFGGQNIMTAQQQAEQSRQFGGNLGLQGAQLGAQTGLSAAGQYANLGQAQNATDLSNLNAMATAGQLQQQNAQQNADVGYQNFVDARDFQKNNQVWLNNLIRGTPAGSTVTQTGPQPSATNQVVGLGLGALGAYKAFGG